MGLKFANGLFGLALVTGVAALPLESYGDEDLSTEDLLTMSGDAGHEISVRGYMSFQSDCKFNGLPQILLNEPPRHGIVCLRIGDIRVEKVFIDAPNCLNLMIRGVRIIYLPRSDFIGTDQMDFTVLFPSGFRKTVRTILNVSPGAHQSPHTTPTDVTAPIFEVRPSPGQVHYCSAKLS